jgi:hypothetical protein
MHNGPFEELAGFAKGFEARVIHKEIIHTVAFSGAWWAGREGH